MKYYRSFRINNFGLKLRIVVVAFGPARNSWRSIRLAYQIYDVTFRDLPYFPFNALLSDFMVISC